MEIIIAHKAELLGILLLVSEILGSSPKIKANSLFQLGQMMLKKALGK